MPGSEKRSSTASMLRKQLTNTNLLTVSQLNLAKRENAGESSDSDQDDYNSMIKAPLNVVLYGNNQFSLLRGHIDNAIKQDLMPTSKSDLEPNVTFYPTLLNFPTDKAPANVGIKAPPANSNLAVFICPMLDKDGAIVIDANIESNMQGVLAKKPEDRPPCFFVVPSDLKQEQVAKLEAIFPTFPVIKTDLLKEEFDRILGSGHTESAYQSKVAQLFVDLNDKLPKSIAEETKLSTSVTPSASPSTKNNFKP
jgi:hypothetical protein